VRIVSEEPIESTGAAEVANAIAETLEKAGAHPAHVFAVRQCGFLLTDANMDTFSEDDVAEWEDALDRWFEMHPDADPL
jgi:hypothetical protein